MPDIGLSLGVTYDGYIADSVTPPSGSFYRQPDGVSRYNRPDRTSFYLRP